MNNSPSRTAIDTLAGLSEEAFHSAPSHSLLANLHALREEDWTATPPKSGPSIADILEHVGWSKRMYEDSHSAPHRCAATNRLSSLRVAYALGRLAESAGL